MSEQNKQILTTLKKISLLFRIEDLGPVALEVEPWKGPNKKLTKRPSATEQRNACFWWVLGRALVSLP